MVLDPLRGPISCPLVGAVFGVAHDVGGHCVAERCASVLCGLRSDSIRFLKEGNV